MTQLRLSRRWMIEIIRTALILVIVLAIGAVFDARGDSHDTTFYACLYAGSLSQINLADQYDGATCKLRAR